MDVADARHPDRGAGRRGGARGHDPARLRVLPRVGARGLAAAAAQPRDPLDPRAAAGEHHLVRDGARRRGRARRPRRHHARGRARAPARAHRRPRAPVDAVRAPAVVGERAGDAPAPARRSRRRRARATRRSASTRRTAPPARGPSTSARAGSSPAARSPSRCSGSTWSSTGATAVIPERLFEDAARALARLDAHALAAGADGLAHDGPGRGRRRRVVGGGQVAVGPSGAVLRAGGGDHRARPELLRARAPGGRARRRGHARRRDRRPARLPARHRRAAARPGRLRRGRARHVLRDEPAVRQPGRDLGGARVHDRAAERRASRSRARSTR